MYPPPSLHHSPMEVSEHLDIFVCFNQEQGGRTSMLGNRGGEASIANN